MKIDIRRKRRRFGTKIFSVHKFGTKCGWKNFEIKKFEKFDEKRGQKEGRKNAKKSRKNRKKVQKSAKFDEKRGQKKSP